jgi:hypothetical protein
MGGPLGRPFCFGPIQIYFGVAKCAKLVNKYHQFARKRQMPVITNIQDLKDIYIRRVPKMFYDYTESGSWSEQTFRENVSDFDQIRLKQRVAVDMTNRSTATR